MTNTKRITGQLPRPTLAQRLRSMPLADLLIAARGLAKDAEQDALCTAVLEELERRAPGDGFDAFVAEIYA